MAGLRQADPEREDWHRGGSSAYAIYRAEIERVRPGFWRTPDLPGRAQPTYEQNAPDLRLAFDRTNPDFDRQFNDLGRTEAERREDSGRGSHMIEEEAPTPVLKPRDRGGIDRSAFNDRWHRETMEAANAQIQMRASSLPDHLPEDTRVHEPQTGR